MTALRQRMLEDRDPFSNGHSRAEDDARASHHGGIGHRQ